MKTEKKTDQNLNRHINLTVVKERFPESNMAKESVEDAERVKSAVNPGTERKPADTFPEDMPQGAD